MCKTLCVAKIVSIGYTTSMVVKETRVPSRGMRQTVVLMERETMGRYIDYDAIDYRNDRLHDKSEEFLNGVIYMAQRIEEAPSIDIEPKRGEWIGYNADKGDDWLRSDGEPIFLVCNKCHGTVMNNTSAHWNFCPNCGADMRERKESE